MNRRRPYASIAAAALAAVSLACSLTGATATPTPAPALTDTPTPAAPGETPTLTPAAATGSISGRVWHDLCNPGPDGGPAPTATPSGCAGDPGTGYSANGLFEPGEPFIGGVVVRLGAGACPSTGLGEVTAAEADPSYLFAGLGPGDYCVSIDPLAEPTLSVLIPGSWTHPAAVDGAVSTTISLAGGEARGEVDFGWDFQFLPLDGGPTPTAAAGGPQRVSFAPGAVSAALTGSVAFPDRDEYVLRALAGQQMTIEIRSPTEATNFAVTGDSDGQPFKRLENEDRTWTGTLTTTQDYRISVAAPGGSADYTLLIAILPEPGAAVLGWVWLDYCTLSTGSGPSAGCLDAGGGTIRANGIPDDGETGIVSVVVGLSSGACPGGAEAATATTDERGDYYFGGLDAGDYCVSIDPLRAENSTVLIPGDFSFPAPGQVATGLTLDENQVIFDADFGWDFQFD